MFSPIPADYNLHRLNAHDVLQLNFDDAEDGTQHLISNPRYSVRFSHQFRRIVESIRF